MLIHFVMLFPAFCFVLAAIFETQVNRTSLRSASRGLPLVVGVCLSGLLFVPLHQHLPSLAAALLLSKALAVTSLVIATCGIVSRFRSKVAAAFVVIGGIALAWFWFLHRVSI